MTQEQMINTIRSCDMLGKLDVDVVCDLLDAALDTQAKALSNGDLPDYSTDITLVNWGLVKEDEA